MNVISFNLVHTDKNCAARLGELTTLHGIIKTPIFMPVGTVGSVKSINQSQLSNIINAQIILGNTYHLYLRPTTHILKQAGGLHQFMNWSRPILTDSGGFQVFSLEATRKVSEQGVTFKSIIDGSKHFFSPESVIDTQRIIGADIMMAFDECLPYPSTEKKVVESLQLTHKWLERCFQQFAQSPALYGYEQTLFPIVQGGMFKQYRKISCEFVEEKSLIGNAIGGLSVGEPIELMYDLTQYCCENLSTKKARYLMGVGTPANLLECISLGVDMFDCVLPARNGRNGMLFTTNGIINIKNKKWATDFTVLDNGLENECSSYYSKAYLRHLFIANELLAYQLATIQNLCFFMWLMEQARNKIKDNCFIEWKNSILPIIMQRL
ncbi:MAG: tRNA guanosine(34) transglycosylase Tgt [Sediminibacterium sp.]|nr:tRNA guanosine(34) transglycosylase Tgt [Sediminibacterium sp.]